MAEVVPSPVGTNDDLIDREEGELTPQKTEPTSHPLEHEWTLWFDNPNGRTKSQWGNTLRSVHTFATVEDFWCLFNNVVTPSRLMSGADFHLFKKGIEPKWEDPKCAKGGRWTISFSKNKTALDGYWLNTILAIIGEQFDNGEEICGVVASIRPSNAKLSLWTKTAVNEAAQLNIAKQWKGFLDATDKLVYNPFEESLKNRSRDLYTA